MREILFGLATAIRSAVLSHFGQEPSRQHSGVAASGDTTFHADTAAEQALERFLRESGAPVAYYSEDAGYVPLVERPEAVLVIDPIDGTRPLLCGFEACTVSVALIPSHLPLTMGNVAEGIVLEIPSGTASYAVRGQGAEVVELDGSRTIPTPSGRTSPEAMFVAFEAAGAPIAELMALAGPLLERTSLTGGMFLWNSSAFALTRVANGQLDAFFSIAERLLLAVPSLEARFLEAGRGRVVGLFPYDIAAAALIAQEAGVTVTDGMGRPLDDRPALAAGREGLLSCVAAATPDLHRGIFERLARA